MDHAQARLSARRTQAVVALNNGAVRQDERFAVRLYALHEEGQIHRRELVRLARRQIDWIDQLECIQATVRFQRHRKYRMGVETRRAGGEGISGYPHRIYCVAVALP